MARAHRRPPGRVIEWEFETLVLPQDFLISTYFDFGPRVTRTASARALAPLSTFSRASERKSSFL